MYSNLLTLCNTGLALLCYLQRLWHFALDRDVNTVPHVQYIVRYELRYTSLFCILKVDYSHGNFVSHPGFGIVAMG